MKHYLFCFFLLSLSCAEGDLRRGDKLLEILKKNRNPEVVVVLSMKICPTCIEKVIAHFTEFTDDDYFLLVTDYETDRNFRIKYRAALQRNKNIFLSKEAALLFENEPLSNLIVIKFNPYQEQQIEPSQVLDFLTSLKGKN
jgi:hypothetical protein